MMMKGGDQILEGKQHLWQLGDNVGDGLGESPEYSNSLNKMEIDSDRESIAMA